MEMNMFKQFGKKGQGIRTNMINRLKVMCFEELCFCVPNHFLAIMQKISEWEEGGRENDHLLIEICNIFCKSELLRLPSDIKNYYWNVVPKVIKECFGSALTREANPNLIKKYKKKGDDERVLKHLANFVKGLEEKNDDVFYDAFEIMKLAISGVKGARRFRRKDCDYIIWEVLFDQIGSTALYTETSGGLINITPKLNTCLNFALKEYFKKNRFMKGDRTVVMVTAILWVMHKNKLDWRPSGDVYCIPTYDWSKPFVPDNYIVDRHCSAGRKAGKTIADFATEGSLVVNENKEWFNKKYRDAYIAGKTKGIKKKCDDLEEGLETIDFKDLINLEPCMIRTCGNKAMCFFAEYKGKQICLKEGRKSMNYNRDYIVVDSLKKLFGLRDLGMTRVKMDKVSKKKDKALDMWEGNTEWLDEKGTVYSMMNRVNGERLSWNKERINMSELVKIGLFRGIFRVTDFNLTNVLGDEDGNLWSIDEHQIGVKKNIFGKKCGWVKDITKEIVDEALENLMENFEVKVRKIVEKMTHYKFKKELIVLCGKNYKNLKKRVYKEMGWEN
tara:strand:+ start:712 stop:2385 length:1674 start_codon:yes stop_codon:yes gene_type:complete